MILVFWMLRFTFDEEAYKAMQIAEAEAIAKAKAEKEAEKQKKIARDTKRRNAKKNNEGE